ncbi:DUF4238 domain-containing protein [Stenotrophomonas sepilia]|nr:DUF4238 domain-containing protein [Stenotrophomonas sepilia]
MNLPRYHHFVHDSYLRGWERNGMLRVYDLRRRLVWSSKARNTGGENHFNTFLPDPVVIDALAYALSSKRGQPEDAAHARFMSALTAAVSNQAGQRDQTFIESRFNIWESEIGPVLARLANGERECLDEGTRASLIKLFCMQIMRTPAMRGAVLGKFRGLTFAGQLLDARQTEDFFKLLLVAHAEAMASALMVGGSYIKLHSSTGLDLLSSDRPAALVNWPLSRIEDLVGFMPLSPGLAMTIAGSDKNGRSFPSFTVSQARVEQWNHLMIDSADTLVFFTDDCQVEKYRTHLQKRAALRIS